MTINIGGLNINYTIKGSGDFIFLLHGWGSNLNLFSNLADEISSKYTVVSMDFPGFGKSEEPKSAWDISAYTDYTVDFIRHFSCERVILLGHSFGGRVIIKMSARDDLPFIIEKTILVDSAGILPKKTLKQKLKTRAYKIGKCVFNFAPVKKMFPNAIESHKKKFGSSDYINASEIMRNVLVKTVNEDLEPLLKNIKAPTLLIWGENDTATPLADGQRMEKAIAATGTDVGLVVLKGAGHYSFIDQQYAFFSVVKSFLKVGE